MYVLGVLVFLFVSGLIGTVHAQDDGQRSGGQSIVSLQAAKRLRLPLEKKVTSQLLDAFDAAEKLAENGDPAAFAPVMVDIRADVTSELLAYIRGRGGAVVNSLSKYRAIRARLPLAEIKLLAGLDGIQFIRMAEEERTRLSPGFSPFVRSDAAPIMGNQRYGTSEGDAAHQVDVARQTYGVDGTGIGIGVLSNGVGTLADRQASGELPAGVTVLPGQTGSGDEGTAILEIIHDLAPGADLYFATGSGGGQAQFAANIEALCTAGADVIVDDIIFFLEPAFQESIATQGVNAAVADGCFYFSAAGNGGNLNDGTAGVWEGDYAPGRYLTMQNDTVGVMHDFGSGVSWNRITNDDIGFVLQWADPLGASVNDYDLFLIDAVSDSVLAYSNTTQDGTQDPIESISSKNADHTNARLVIVKHAGADRYLRLDTLEGQLETATAGNTFGHAAAANMIGVGMVDVRTTRGTGGVFNGTESVRITSSDGPRRVFFQADGTPITPGNFSSTGGQQLQKPDIVAATCVSTTTPGFETFCGTSSAAPHAAAIAALMLEAAGGHDDVTLAELHSAFTESALDIEAPGIDRDSGSGIVMAPLAVAAFAPPAFTTPDMFSVEESRAGRVGIVQAQDDAAPGGIQYTITGGADWTQFVIIRSTGYLTFRSAPNYEDPQDVLSTNPQNDAGNNEYVVTVTATSRVGNRSKTAEQTIVVSVIDDDTEAPDRPDRPSVSPTSATSLVVYWSEPANNGPPITDYDYRYRTSSPQGNWTEVTDTVITGLGARIENLAENTEYGVQVRATNAEGTGGWSPQGMGTTGDVDPTLGQVTGVSVIEQEEQLVVSWNEMFEADGYKVQWKSGGQAYNEGNRQHIVGDGATIEYTISNLIADTEYTVRVIATRNGLADGPPSVEVTGTPLSVRAHGGQVTGVSVIEQVEQLVVSWNEKFEADGYKVQWKSGGQDYNEGDRQHIVGDGATTEYTISNLVAGAEYTVRVIATRNGFPSPPSVEVTGTPLSPQPFGQVTGVSVIEQVEQLVVSWNEMFEADGYKVQWKSGEQDYNEGNRQHIVGDGATTEYTISNLVAGAEYTVRVIATRNGLPDGPPSVEVTGTPLSTTPPPTTIADAPENLQAIAGNAQVTLSWDAPGDDGGADITGYTYRHKESGGDFTAYMDIPDSGPGEANARTYTVTGLTNGQEYVFHVHAVNEHGGGLPAEAVATPSIVLNTESEEIPTEVALIGNYPNPFNPETTIGYVLPKVSEVRLVVYNLLGHEMTVLVDGLQPAGHHTVRFSASDLPSGSYVYRLQTGNKAIARSMILVK